MKYVLGGLALIAAVIIVGCSATTLFLTAFNSVQEPWQQWLQGAGIAAVVAWEAAAVLVIGYCFKTRHWATGIGAVVLLVLAMAVTSRMELRLYLGGQADVMAGRTVQAEDRARVKAELDRAYDRRDKLQERERLTPAQAQELKDVRVRIADLEKRWDTRTENVHSSGRAEGEFFSMLFGADANLSQAMLDSLPLWFWMVARVFSIPGVVVAISAMRSESRVGARQRQEDEPVSLVAAGRFPAPVARSTLPERRSYEPSIKLEFPRSAENDGKGGNEPVAEVFPDAGKNPPVDPDGGKPASAPDPVAEPEDDGKVIRANFGHTEDTPPAGPRVKKASRKEGEVKSWLEDSTSQTDDKRVKATAAECRASYLSWCQARNLHPVHQKVMSRQLGVLLGRGKGKGRAKRDKNGSVFIGLMINPIVAQQRTRRVA